MEFVENIDEIDRKILQIITQNARKPFKDVAELVGISRAAVHQRVQKCLIMELLLALDIRLTLKLWAIICVFMLA